jgi:hypothetical protein
LILNGFQIRVIRVNPRLVIRPSQEARFALTSETGRLTQKESGPRIGADKRGPYSNNRKLILKGFQIRVIRVIRGRPFGLAKKLSLR